jgi:hypothetical protein
MIRQLIDSEIEKLLNIARGKIQINPKFHHERGKLTNLSVSKLGRETWKIDQTYDNINEKTDQPLQKRETWENDSLFYSDSNVHDENSHKRKCLVTGFDISMQKGDSKFLCTTGIKYYKKNDPKIWLQLRKRLSPRWHGCSEDSQIREIHHSIRNEYFNIINNTRRSIKKLIEEPALFNQLNLISHKKLKQARLTV